AAGLSAQRAGKAIHPGDTSRLRGILGGPLLHAGIVHPQIAELTVGAGAIDASAAKHPELTVAVRPRHLAVARTRRITRRGGSLGTVDALHRARRSQGGSDVGPAFPRPFRAGHLDATLRPRRYRAGAIG